MALNREHLGHLTTTHRVLTISWSGLGDTVQRQQRWGGKINNWNVDVLQGGALYLIPNTINVSDIHDALVESLLPSDRAVLTYPYGETDSGASAMRVRMYGSAVLPKAET